MHASAATRANRALWSHYLHDQWGPLLAPLGGDAAADAIGDAIALWYETTWGGFIDRLFATNARTVTRFAEESRTGAHVTPEQSPRPAQRSADLDAPPPWLRAVVDVYHPHEEAPARSREPHPVT